VVIIANKLDLFFIFTRLFYTSIGQSS